MNKPELYRLNHRIDEPARIVGLTIDEALPIIAVLGLALIFGAMVTGFLIAASFYCLMQSIKKGQGSGWLLCLMYWRLPHWVSRCFLKTMPPSHQRFFLN